MIKNKLSEMMGRRRLSIADLARQAGVHYNACYRWYNDTIVSYDAKVLEAFCKFFTCTIGDLLEYVPEPAKEEQEAG